MEAKLRYPLRIKAERTAYMVIGLVASLALPFVAMSFSHAQAVQVTGLQCNYATNPLGISEATPSLSWKIIALQRGQRQTAYQILVASDSAKLNEAEADSWNSGKILSDQSVHIPFRGKPLQARQRYHWKVRIWDRNGTLSNYSETNFWEMALLQPEAWKAQWISAPVLFDLEKFNLHRFDMINKVKADYTEPLPLLRKEFIVSKKIQQARLYVAAPGFYAFFLNGKKVGDQVLDPAFTNFDKTVLYTVHDVGSLLQSGANAAGVMLGNGWYNSVTKEVWGFDRAPWRNWPALKCQIEIVYTDGTTDVITSDGSWLAHTGPITFSSLRQGEYYDARLEINGWNLAGLDTSNWQPVRRVAGPLGKLMPQTIPPVRMNQQLKPVKFQQLVNGNTVYDFGQNIAGWVAIEVRGEAGAQIQVVYAEKTKPDGATDQSGINNLNVDVPFQTDRYVLKGGGAETWQPRFVYHGFRYVEVSASEKATINRITALAIHTSFEKTGSFSCSNVLVNAIQQSTEWSFRNNFIGIPTDCPQREKNGWTGDAQLACETGLTNFAPYTSYLKWLHDIEDEQKPDGSLPGIIPTSGWGYYWGNGPAWDIACIVIPFSMFEYTGDTLLLKKYYSMMKRYVDYMNARSVNGIVSFGLGDWIPVKTETPAEVTSTGYFYYGAFTLAKIARILGEKTDVATYTRMAATCKEAFNKTYLDTKTYQYANGSQTALSCALFQGLTPEKWTVKVVENLVQAVHQKDNHIDCGILGARYIFHALSDHRNADLAFEMITQKTYPGWGYWIAQGATTLWEDWRGEASRNHIMLGDVSSWFYKTLGGIRPDFEKPGFKHFFLKPQILGDVTWANARYESLYGTISGNWKKTGDIFYYEVTIPPNTSATAYLPGNAITESQKPLAKAVGAKRVGKREGMTIIALESGTYTFEARMDK